MKKVVSITLHDSPATDAKAAAGTTNVLRSVSGAVDVNMSLQGISSLTLPVGAASPFGMAILDSGYFSQYDTVKVNYDDDSVDVWTVRKVQESLSGDGFSVVCWPYWTLLARRKLRVFREPSHVVDTTLTIREQPAAVHLSEIMANNAPPHFAVGTVAAPLADHTFDIESIMGRGRKW